MVLTVLIAWTLLSIPVALVLAAALRLRVGAPVPTYATVVSGRDTRSRAA